jgi:hypothetical protein
MISVYFQKLFYLSADPDTDRHQNVMDSATLEGTLIYM